MPKINLDDTIAAIATPAGEGGISVIRVSGPGAIQVAERVFSPAGKTPVRDFKTHTVHLGHITDEKKKRLDQVLLSLFKSPRSYTGEDVVEMSSHGGMAVTRRILEVILRSGARMAEPGEFTKRAFLNGRIDLTQAEGVIDLIRARSERSVRAALRQLEGSLSAKFRQLRDRLMKIYAHMEAYVDFPEEDIEVYSDETFAGRFREIKGELSGLAGSFKRGSLLREGVTCVIAGKPNVGKSSLFNALLERDRALVSEYEGTTRDMLEEAAEIDGIYIRLIDTAGLGHGGAGPLDQIGMERTRRALDEARLVLYVLDGSAELEQRDLDIFREINGKPCLVLINKSDKPLRLDENELREQTGTGDFIRISAVSREGFSELEKRIAAAVLEGGLDEESEQITRLRHKTALETALRAVERAEEAFLRKESLELVTMDLKEGLDALSELIGEIYSEDLLEVIFSEFCIGK